jgi:AraC-like DNA-binding protein
MSDNGGRTSMNACNDDMRLKRSSLPVSLFSTADLPPAERFGAWRESIGVIFDVSLPSKPTPLFDARVEGYLIEDIVLARCCAGAQKFDRSSIRVAQDSIDHYMIQLVLSGCVDLNRAGKRLRVDAGGLIAFDLAEVLDSFNSDFELLSVIIPRRRLAPLLKHPDSVQGAMIDPEGGSGKLFAGFLVSLFTAAPTLSLAEGSLAARSLVDLTALALSGATVSAGAPPEFVQQSELLRVQSFIKERLAMPDLEPDKVAEGVGTSRAQLYRLFAPIGGVAEYIRQQRLRRCFADLLSAQHAHRQIADIAYGWGFNDPGHFAKAFKQRFGRTPSEMRDTATLARKQCDVAIDDRAGDRMYEEWISAVA